MHLRILCIVFWISFCLASETEKWEVINDVKAWDDSSSQDELLSEEHLIPLNAHRRPKAVSAGQRHDGHIINTGVKSQSEASTLKPRAVYGAPVNKDDSFAVRNQGSDRKLLNVEPLQGLASMPQDSENAKSSKLKSTAVNLSTPCKESEETVKKESTGTKKTQTVINDSEDLTFINKEVNDDDEEDEIDPFIRKRRQAVIADEGSGSNLYNERETHTMTGQYKVTKSMTIKITKTSVTKDEELNYRKEIEEKLRNAFSNVTEVVDVVIESFEIINGEVRVNWSLVVDASRAYNQLGSTSVLEDILYRLNNAGIQYNNLTFLNTTLESDSYWNPFDVDTLKSKLQNYCLSESPCGLEYESCVSTGDMSGYCTHKCVSYENSCQNNAICELDKDYTPFCNCGKLWTGKYCSERKTDTKELSTAEIVGITLGAVVACVALVSCCCFFVCCFRKGDRHVRYTYYEDEERSDRASDPTSGTISNYYIDRPIVRSSPISVFNSSSGFDA